MNCCIALRSHPVVFVAVAALSAIAFVGETLGSGGFADDARVTTLAVAVAGGRIAHR